MAEKLCKGDCGRTLPATKEYFWGAPSNKDGLRNLCKECQGKANMKAKGRYYLNKREGAETKRSQDAYYREQKKAAERERNEPIDDFDFGCKRALLNKPRQIITSVNQEIQTAIPENS